MTLILAATVGGAVVLCGDQRVGNGAGGSSLHCKLSTPAPGYVIGTFGRGPLTLHAALEAAAKATNGTPVGIIAALLATIPPGAFGYLGLFVPNNGPVLCKLDPNASPTTSLQLQHGVIHASNPSFNGLQYSPTLPALVDEMLNAQRRAVVAHPGDVGPPFDITVLDANGVTAWRVFA